MYGGENVTVRHEEFACEMKVTVAVTFLVGIIQVKNTSSDSKKGAFVFFVVESVSNLGKSMSITNF